MNSHAARLATKEAVLPAALPRVSIPGSYRESEMNYESIWDIQHRLRELSQLYDDSHGTNRVWHPIREAYDLMEPFIIKNEGCCSPYWFDWKFTPIEELAWQDIRGTGMRLFPQVPACGFFIDFADPCLKIGVELDGKGYHDEARDRIRDKKLWASGWRIFRIPGFKSLPSGNHIFDEGWHERFHFQRDEFLDDLREWADRWSEGIFWAIDFFYYKKPERRAREFASAAYHALDLNRLADFPIDPRDEE